MRANQALRPVAGHEIAPLLISAGERIAVDERSINIALFGPFRLVKGSRLLERDGEPVSLGSRAFDILTLLVERAGAVVSKRDLIERGWPDLTVDESSLRVQLVALRRTLGEGVGGARYITNVPGRGYCFVAPTSFEAFEPARPTAPVTNIVQSRVRGPEDMIGRDEFVRRIEFLLHTYRFVTIHGAGGIGKTTVALAAAAAAASAFDGNVVLLDLVAIEDAALLPSALASALGLMVHDHDTASTIVERLKDHRALIVFDSCEQAVEQVTALAEDIHRQAMGVAILVTSREPLRAAGEHVVQLAPLTLPPLDQKLTLNQLMQFSAARLFAERAFAAGLSFELTGAERLALARICNSLDGIPLAIEIAARRVGSHGLHETAQLLDGRLRLIWQGRRSAPTRHQTLHATLDWSYDLLTATEKVVLQRLSLLAGRFPRTAASVLAPDDLPSPDSALDELVSKSLVTIDVREGAASYRLLDTTRAYASDKLEESGDKDRARRKHLDYVGAALVEIENRRASQHSDVALEFRDLLGDVRAALRYVFDVPSRRADAVALVGRAAPFFFQSSLFEECRSWIERALNHLQVEERSSTVELQLEGAYGPVLMLTHANSPRAQQALERSIRIAEEKGDLRTAFQLLNWLQVLHRRTAEYHRLIPLVEKSEALAGQIGDEAATTSASLMRGLAHAFCGDQITAERLLREALQLQIESPLPPSHYAYPGDARVPLSMTLWLRGRADQAATAARIVSENTYDVLFSCLALSWAAIVFQTMGDSRAASELVERLRRIASMHGLGPYIAIARAFEGEHMLEEGEAEEGVRLLQESIIALRSKRYGLYESIFSRPLALGLLQVGITQEAERLTVEQLRMIESRGGAYDQPEWLRIRALVERAQGKSEMAQQTLRSSISLAATQGAISWQLRSSILLASTLKEQGLGEEAAAELQPVIEQFQEGFATRDLIEASQMLEELQS